MSETVVRLGSRVFLLDPQATFPAESPFHIAHGFGAEGASDTSLAGAANYSFELFVDGTRVLGTREAILVGDQWTRLTWVSNFPDGLGAGVHIIRGVWMSPDSSDRTEEHSILFTE